MNTPFNTPSTSSSEHHKLKRIRNTTDAEKNELLNQKMSKIQNRRIDILESYFEVMKSKKLNVLKESRTKKLMKQTGLDRSSISFWFYQRCKKEGFEFHLNQTDAEVIAPSTSSKIRRMNKDVEFGRPPMEEVVPNEPPSGAGNFEFRRPEESEATTSYGFRYAPTGIVALPKKRKILTIPQKNGPSPSESTGIPTIHRPLQMNYREPRKSVPRGPKKQMTSKNPTTPSSSSSRQQSASSTSTDGNSRNSEVPMNAGHSGASRQPQRRQDAPSSDLAPYMKWVEGAIERRKNELAEEEKKKQANASQAVVRQNLEIGSSASRTNGNSENPEVIKLDARQRRVPNQRTRRNGPRNPEGVPQQNSGHRLPMGIPVRDSDSRIPTTSDHSDIRNFPESGIQGPSTSKDRRLQNLNFEVRESAVADPQVLENSNAGLNVDLEKVEDLLVQVVLSEGNCSINLSNEKLKNVFWKSKDQEFLDEAILNALSRSEKCPPNEIDLLFQNFRFLVKRENFVRDRCEKVHDLLNKNNCSNYPWMSPLSKELREKFFRIIRSRETTENWNDILEAFNFPHSEMRKFMDDEKSRRLRSEKEFLNAEMNDAEDVHGNTMREKVKALGMSKYQFTMEMSGSGISKIVLEKWYNENWGQPRDTAN